MSSHVGARREILDTLKRDMFGPYDGENEELTELPVLRYSTGVLYPQSLLLVPDEDDGGTGQESQTMNDDTEPTLSLSNVMYPSCYGMTFTCKKGTKEIQVLAGAGIYKEFEAPKKTESKKTEKELKEEESGEEENQGKAIRKNWKREPLRWTGVVPVNKPTVESIEITPGLVVVVRVRKADTDGDVTVTLSVINKNRINDSGDLSSKCRGSFFQIHFQVNGINGEHSFVDKKGIVSGDMESELKSINLLYRKTSALATGHGCATTWEDSEGKDASQIESTFIPEHLIYPMRPPKDLDLPDFSIKSISESSSGELKNLFEDIYTKYVDWVDELQNEADNLDGDFKIAAENNIKSCLESAKRIRKGIHLLANDEHIHKAFILAHKAILHQFAISAWNKTGRSENGPIYDFNHSWYPFQIAFILQCLESVSDPESSERNLVDLLWFPTGGGKTEAYLGLIAFAWFLRRLRRKNEEDKGGGTVALMRYTLRLLTVDQFHRAVLLACSCEKTRKEDPEISETAPISIGLWVGGEASPNTLKEAKKALVQLQSGGELVDGGSPVKISECPWCGHDLGPADYYIPKNESMMLVKCSETNCDFRDGLPVWVVDDDVYRERPSLVIGTVDKFARLPWVEEAGNIFGTDGKTIPPELIIQDELHLISGPLGTLVGLYETAVDKLCENSDGIGPKIISSTATIRNSARQIESLFGREARQFPPSGTKYNDSFFAREDRSDPGRLYVGIFTPGTSPTTALVRTFGSLLHGTHKTNATDDVRDAYWTLLGYFNSLRELGGARTQVEDDVKDYLKFCAERDGDKKDFRLIEHVAELTSRVTSTELEEVRKQLSETIGGGDPLDVVLASNMISVGLDVPRLGLMCIVGQPKSTSEYIQASSRIGRRYPGMVVSIYNWTRSRDRSHYERFKGYHSRLYSEVEATSVTPFSSRARERGLHAVLITLVRYLVKDMRSRESAVLFDPEDPAVSRLVDYILDRADIVDKLERKDTEMYLIEIMNQWKELSMMGELPYADSSGIALMKSAEDVSVYLRSFATLNSLRNVDPSAGIFLYK